ncbi:hypothetical protein WJX73_002619 [Symbiochloris irregularis]|uniref:Uncharacterized protein n=1 Tax=Symbiochloris irregularis TaxID=706552 RepID=A0AAW1NX17_9CHLO
MPGNDKYHGKTPRSFQRSKRQHTQLKADASPFPNPLPSAAANGAAPVNPPQTGNSSEAAVVHLAHALVSHTQAAERRAEERHEAYMQSHKLELEAHKVAINQRKMEQNQMAWDCRQPGFDMTEECAIFEELSASPDPEPLPADASADITGPFNPRAAGRQPDCPANAQQCNTAVTGTKALLKRSPSHKAGVSQQ